MKCVGAGEQESRTEGGDGRKCRDTGRARKSHTEPSTRVTLNTTRHLWEWGRDYKVISFDEKTAYIGRTELVGGGRCAKGNC